MTTMEGDSNTKIIVHSLEEAMVHLREHELQHTLRFSAFMTKKDFGQTGKLPTITAPSLTYDMKFVPYLEIK